MKPMHFLVAEDDKNIRDGLIDILESEGYKATPAIDGEQALTFFKNGIFDFVILDIMMPGKSGYDVCKEIRSSDAKIPVIMLTAKGEEIDKVVGLKLGADDYITKPFGVHELLARISAVSRRSQQYGNPQPEEIKPPDRFIFGKVEIDATQYKVRKGKKNIDLSDRELRLLQFFHANPNIVLSRDKILNSVWGINYFGTTRTLDQHIAQLRKKIEPDVSQPVFIITVHGIGYRYVPVS